MKKVVVLPTERIPDPYVYIAELLAERFREGEDFLILPFHRGEQEVAYLFVVDEGDNRRVFQQRRWVSVAKKTFGFRMTAEEVLKLLLALFVDLEVENQRLQVGVTSVFE